MTLQHDTKDMQLALGGDMAWKKALFLGGAVLLLAACSDATAPSTLRPGGSAANLKATQPIGAEALPMSTLDDCRSGYYVRSGDRDICLGGIELQ